MAQGSNKTEWKTIAIWGGGLVATAGLVALVVSGAGSGSSERPDPPLGVETSIVTDRSHVEGPIEYGSADPPAGGNHNPVWLACGFYDSQVPTENAVHAIEHGVVWITYQSGLSEDEMDTLESYGGDSETIVSLFASQTAPVVATAWGNQLKLDSAEDARLEQFQRAFRDAPSAPEPAASCQGGIRP